MGLIESVYTTLLGIFALVGMIRLAGWLFKRSWHWVFITIAVVILLAGMVSRVQLVQGGMAEDLRFITELLATGGLVLSVRWALGQKKWKKSRWVQLGIPAFAVVMIGAMWHEQIVHFVRGDYSIQRVAERAAAERESTLKLSAPHMVPIEKATAVIDCVDIAPEHRPDRCN